MRIAITGGTGFIGRHLARHLGEQGHEIVLISRRGPGAVGADETGAGNASNVRAVASGLDDVAALTGAFTGCDAVAHCAGINREIGRQTYQRVHVDGTARVVEAARVAGVRRIALMSFLRARPACGSPYHESKFAAEEIVRASGLDYTILKCGVVYGRGDHMLDHLSHAFHTFPVFGLVGFKDRPVRPTAVDDVVRILAASVVEGRLAGRTVAVTGPEQMTLPDAVLRVQRVVGKRPWTIRLPLWFHYAFAWVTERVMTVPMVSTSQVRMLAEGVVEPVPADVPQVGEVEPDLAPLTPFSDAMIRAGLPEGKGFGLADCRCFSRLARA